MKAFDAAVAFGVIVRGAPMGNAQLARGFQVARRSKRVPLSVVKVKVKPFLRGSKEAKPRSIA